MDCDSGKEFPKAFGDTPDDFLDRFGGLIYTIILRICKQERMVITPEGKYVVIRLEPQNVFNGFIAHIAKDYYRVLRNYEHRNNAQPQTYLGKVIRWFTIAEMKREEKKSLREAIDEQEITVILGDGQAGDGDREKNDAINTHLALVYPKMFDDPINPLDMSDTMGLQAEGCFLSVVNIHNIDLWPHFPRINHCVISNKLP